MNWASAISEHPALDQALDETVASVKPALAGAAAHLAVVFVSPHHVNSFAALPALLAERLPGAMWIGATADGVIGAGHEVEDGPAISLTVAHLPGVALYPVRFGPMTAADDSAAAEATSQPMMADQALLRGLDPHWLLLGDPFTCDAQPLVKQLDAEFPTGRKIGGLASGGRRPGTTRLLLGDQVHPNGAVAVAMTGNLTIDTLVAQGCRAIGPPMPITRCEKHFILELAGKSPETVLREVYTAASVRDRELMLHSLFLGLDMHEERMEYREGELLVRNIIGIDPERKALAVAAPVRQWQVVQLVLRDAETADEDLRDHLARYRSEGNAPQGALLFSCLGRGRGLFGVEDHDTDLFRSFLGAVPLGGFFCNGEIGPVGGQTFLHGYTSAFALFRPRD